jgi:hypothetical protein
MDMKKARVMFACALLIFLVAPVAAVTYKTGTVNITSCDASSGGSCVAVIYDEMVAGSSGKVLDNAWLKFKNFSTYTGGLQSVNFQFTSPAIVMSASAPTFNIVYGCRWYSYNNTSSPDWFDANEEYSINQKTGEISLNYWITDVSSTLYKNVTGYMYFGTGEDWAKFRTSNFSAGRCSYMADPALGGMWNFVTGYNQDYTIFPDGTPFFAGSPSGGCGNFGVAGQSGYLAVNCPLGGGAYNPSQQTAIWTDNWENIITYNTSSSGIGSWVNVSKNVNGIASASKVTIYDEFQTPSFYNETGYNVNNVSQIWNTRCFFVSVALYSTTLGTKIYNTTVGFSPEKCDMLRNNVSPNPSAPQPIYNNNVWISAYPKVIADGQYPYFNYICTQGSLQGGDICQWTITADYGQGPEVAKCVSMGGVLGSCLCICCPNLSPSYAVNFGLGGWVATGQRNFTVMQTLPAGHYQIKLFRNQDCWGSSLLGGQVPAYDYFDVISTNNTIAWALPSYMQLDTMYLTWNAYDVSNITVTNSTNAIIYQNLMTTDAGSVYIATDLNTTPSVYTASLCPTGGTCVYAYTQVVKGISPDNITFYNGHEFYFDDTIQMYYRTAENQSRLVALADARNNTLIQQQVQGAGFLSYTVGTNNSSYGTWVARLQDIATLTIISSDSAVVHRFTAVQLSNGFDLLQSFNDAMSGLGVSSPESKMFVALIIIGLCTAIIGIGINPMIGMAIFLLGEVTFFFLGYIPVIVLILTFLVLAISAATWMRGLIFPQNRGGGGER